LLDTKSVNLGQGRDAFDDPLAVQYGLTGLPTLLIFKDGHPVERVNGSYSAVELRDKLLEGLN
jgi:thioredoxin-like negative regulator of GroEL